MKEASEKFDRLHPKFKLNGISFTVNSLKSHAALLIEDGEPYEQSVGEFILNWLDGKKYIIVNTSGSTGSPKPIRTQKIHMVNSAKATAKHFDVFEKTTALLCLPAHYIAGKMMLVRAMILGWHIDMALPKSNPLDTVFRTYDFCAMTPLQLDNSLSRLHLISKLIVGGGSIAPTLALRLQGLKTKIYETYGMTETVSHIATRRINPKKERDTPIPFKTLNKIKVEVDERGCLVVKAPLVSTDPVVTNDLVTLISYKKFIWLGRIDNVINSGGVKLHPEQIERKLASYLDVPYFVAGLKDEVLGERLTLFVEHSLPYHFDLSDIRSEEFGSYEVPKHVIAIDRFKRTTSGKIQRGQTVESYLKSLL